MRGKGGAFAYRFDANGVAIPGGSFTFPAAVANGLNQDTILIATSEAAALFPGLVADLSMQPLLPLRGGKVCFGTIDCVAWGAYKQGQAPEAAVGTPFNAPLGLILGQAMKRKLELSGGATTLENGDDTQNSANDFAFGAPTPKNNARNSFAPLSSTCGDGVVAGLEECDGGEGCDGACLLTDHCGDGVTGPAEACDDGNLNNADGCQNDCSLPAVCGDGVLAPGEDCDDGNNLDGDGCSSVCTDENCGNGALDAGEVCDDGNNIDGDGCRGDCDGLEVCGDNLLDVGEVCDDGNTQSEDGCRGDCGAIEECGDGVTQAGLGEGCDEGAANSDTLPNTCRVGCALPSCGDAVIDDAFGEECDDGNEEDGDGCSAACALEICGDGVVNGAEQCDEGNGNSDTGACTTACQSAACGDGFVQAGVEQCDDGNTAAGDGCAADCKLEEPEKDGFFCAVGGEGSPRALWLLGLFVVLGLALRRRR